MTSADPISVDRRTLTLSQGRTSRSSKLSDRIRMACRQAAGCLWSKMGDARCSRQG